MMRNRSRGWKAQFAIIWAGQAVSMLTTSVLQMAVVWYITLKTKSAVVLSATTLIAFLPQAILGTFTGAYIDRYSRKTVLIAADLFIAFNSLLLVVAGFMGDIPITFILVLAGIRSIGSAFHYPTLQAITPLIVPKEHLTKYAGYAKGFESLSGIASPGIAIALYAVLPLSGIALFDVFGALFAVSLLAFVKLPPKQPRQTALKPHLLREVRQGFSVIRHEPGMVPLMLIGALYAVIYFPIGSYYGVSLHSETLINSDQGAHYKSLKFIRLIKDNELRQSMSRKANCWDNAPQESFYGHMKDEIDISLCTCFEEVHEIIVDWTAYYNDERYQWDLARLSPNEYYNVSVKQTDTFPLWRRHEPGRKRAGIAQVHPGYFEDRGSAHFQKH